MHVARFTFRLRLWLCDVPVKLWACAPEPPVLAVQLVCVRCVSPGPIG